MSTPSTDTDGPPDAAQPFQAMLHVFDHADYYEMMGSTLRIEPGRRERSNGPHAIKLRDELIGDIKTIGSLGPLKDGNRPMNIEVIIDVVGTDYVVDCDVKQESVTVESYRTRTPETHVHAVDALEVGFDD